MAIGHQAYAKANKMMTKLVGGGRGRLGQRVEQAEPKLNWGRILVAAVHTKILFF